MRKTKESLKLILIILLSALMLIVNSVTVQADTEVAFNKMGFKQISAGMYQTLAIDESGNLWSWGLNNNGQVGNGAETDADVLTPTQIMPGTKFTQISAGNLFCLALDEDGNIWSFGTNGVGQLGVDGISSSKEPVKIASETTFTKISVGSSHGLAIDINGKLWAWGLNSNGQLGSGTTNNSNVPVQIMSDISFKEITAGYNSSAAISTTGALYTWGENSEGQLGNGTNDAVNIPTEIESGKTFAKVQMSKGGNYTLAIDSEGKLYTWGNNKYGQLGNGTFVNSNTPVAILADKQIKEITAGYNHALAIDEEGKLYAWGANGDGKLGTGDETLTNTPVQISADQTFKKVSAGWNHTVAIGRSGSLYVWGENESGELGTGNNTGSKTPVALSEKEDFSYKIEHYKQTDTGYELVTEDVETIQKTAGEKVTATPNTYEGYIWNKYANGTVQKGEIQPDGSLVLKLYYDKLVETNFNISITNKNAEDSEEIANSKYDITVEYCDGTTLEFKDKVTDENGNITLSNVAGKNIMKVYFKQTAVAGGFNSDTSKKYVEIKINSENSKIELTGAKTAGIIASTEENTLYITQFNNKLNYENSIRIHAVDNIDNEIGLSNIPFTITYPDGRKKQLVTDEEGIAEISNLPAPGKGDFIYEIEQLSTLNGYIENKTVKYVNITFDENGIITKVEPLSDKISANKETENIDSIQNVIANINVVQTRDTENGQNGIFSDYSLHIIEMDKDTNEYIEGVTYKIIEKATTAGLSNVATVTKKTNSVGQINTDVVNGQEVVLTIKRTKVPSEYKLLKEEIKVKLIKNADGQYELQEPVEGVTIDNEAKTITVNRQLYKTTSIHNVARTKVNNEIFITKVDEDLRPLQGVVLELRENTSGTKWELKTDDNGLAKLTNEDIVNSLGSEFPQYLKEGKGKLTFWITEKSVPLGYERIEEDIGFEAYYETTPDGTLEISHMNVLDGLSYYHIVNQEYDQYEKEDYMQVDINLKVINPYADTVDKATLNTLKIEKVDSKNENTKLENATFQITLTYPTLGKLRTIETTNRDGIASIANLYFPEGTSTIEIIETSAPYGYILDTTPTIIKVTNTSGVITVEGATIDSNRTINVKLTNTHKQYAVPFNIVVNKRNKNTNELIDSTAEFKIEVTKGGTTSTYNKYTINGRTSITNLNGTGNIEISVQETDAPFRYKLNNETAKAYITKENMYSSIALDPTKTQSSNVSISGNTVYFTVYDEPEEVNVQPALQIKKVSNKNTDLGLRNAKFSITMPNDEGTRTLTTGYSGYTSLILKNGVSGRYIIEETEAPSGYNLSKKVAIDVVFDENKNITSVELVKDLGEEYVNSIISISKTAKTIYLTIGDAPVAEAPRTPVSTYTVKINKVDKNNKQEKLDGAIFDIDINQQNGSNYSLTKETMYERGIIVSGLEGTGKIDLNLQEVKAPWGYIYDGTTRKLSFTRDETTKALTLDVNSLVNINESDISINNINHTITITVSNTPKTYTPVIREDGTEDPTPIPEGKIYNSITIENEYIKDHTVKIEGTTFRIYRLGSYISQGTTNQIGLTTISLGNTEYYTVEDYLIRNYEMRASSYIKNQDVVLRITYNEDGTMKSAEIISGEQDSQGRIVAEIDKSVNYVGNHRIKVKIRCDKKAYTPISGTTLEQPKEPTTEGETTPGTTKPEEKPSPITPVAPGELEPDFGVMLEKVNIFNNRIKVKNARYAINILNEDTNESETKVGTTDGAGKIELTGLLGFGNFKITVIEINSPEEYALDEYKQVVRIHRDQESQMITMLDKDLNQNASARIDNINKMVKMTIQETPSTIGFAILKQDYEDEEIGLKNSKFQITDNETNDTYELETLEEGMVYVSLPIKENGLHTFTLREIQAPVGYNALTDTLTLKVNYLNGLIASAEIEGNDELAYVTTQNTEYIEANILNQKNIEHGTKYDIELIKADAYYSSITFENAKIKLDIDNEIGQSGISKTTLTNAQGKINVNNIHGSGKATIKITEIEPPPGRRFDTKEKQVILNIDEETGWIKLDKQTSNVDAFVDNDTKKITIRIRNYPDGTFVIGANKVDEKDNDLMLYGAKYQVQMEGSSTTYTLVQYANGLIAAQNIPMPSPVSAGTYTYTITEIEAPFGYKLNTVPTVLKVEVRKVSGINKITNAYIESGSGEVETFGDEYVHLKLIDTQNEITDPEGNNTYKITINKVDSMDKTYVIPNTLIGVHVQAESGENYYKEIKTDENGQINLNNITGTGRITVEIEEIKAAQNYLKANGKETIVFTRNPETKEITIEEGINNASVTEEGNINVTIENTLDLEKAVVITVNKVWKDTELQKEKRPTSIKIQIKRGDQVVREKEISNTEEVAIFTNLPKYDEDGNAINYTVEEQEVNTGDLKYYVSSYDAETNTITNTFRVPEDIANEKVSVTVQKVWVDTEAQKVHRPANIKIVVKNGTEVVQENTITTEANKNVTFTNLPKYDANGNVITYTVEEQEVNTGDLKYYVSSYDAETNTITNTFRVPEDIANEKVSVTVQKVWVDTEAQKVHRPANIKIVVKNGTEVVQENTITTEANKNVTFTNLPKYDANGNVITYTVEEQEVTEGDLKYYVSSYDAETNTITNTFRVPEDIANEKVSITVQKVWVDTEAQKVHRPENIKIVVKNGTEVVQENTITTEANKDVTFTNLPKYDANGNAINYTIEEKEVNEGDLRFYVSSYDADTNTITNTFRVPEDIANEKVSVIVQKVWVDTEAQKAHRPANIKLVVKNGTEEEQAKTITTEADQTVTFEDLAKYDENGNSITYTVQEQEVVEGDLNFYVPSVTRDETTGKITITNTFTLPEDTQNVTVTKVWEDANNVNGKRPESIIIKLLKGEQEITRKIVTGETTEDTWEHTFTKLAKYDANGNEITYTVDEEQVNENDLLYYTKTINQETKEITNTYIVNASIRKVLKDTSIGLEGATIVLIDEQGHETSGVTNKDGYVTFGNLQKGKIYTYKETIAPTGYVLNTNVYTLTVNENGTIDYGENGGVIENEKITADVEITKYISGTSTPVEGAIIGLFDKDGNALIAPNGEQIKARTDSLGTIRILKLGIGTYCYKELEAPAGYVLNEEMYTITVNNDGTITHGANGGIIYNEKVKTDVTITKYIAGTTTPLQGAKIGLFDNNGNPVTNTEGEPIVVTTGENGQAIFTNLEVGTYQYKEIEAPIGYVLNTNVYTFTVNNDGTVTYGESNGIIYNEKIKVDVEITKHIKGTETPLQGAKIGLFDEDGNPLTETNGEQIVVTTGQDGKVTFENLEVGTYKYKELEAPIGYVLNNTMYTFTINNDGTITHGTNNGIIYNEEMKYSASIVKYILGTTTPVQGAVIGLFDEDGNALTETNGKQITITTKENGQAVFTNLSAGTYKYKELQAPTGYVLNSTMYTFTVENDGTITHGANNGIIYNETIKTNVEITKYILGTTTPLQGAEITLYDANGNEIATKTTGENGKVLFENLEEGTYYYKETKAPLGYTLNEETYTFTVNEDGSITHGANGGIIYNDIIRANVTIKKYEQGTTIPVEGAEIGLFDENGNAIIGQNGEQIKARTGTNGEIRILNLRAGTYMYKELQAPMGYILNNTMYTFTVNENGSITHGDNNGIIYNTPKTIDVEIIKKEKGTDIPLKGATIALYKEGQNEIIQTKTTGEDGKGIFTGLRAGTYYYKEMKAPLGYMLNNTTYTFVVNEDRTVNYGENDGIIYNEKIRSNVVIKKYEETTNVKLAGAVIGLFDENGNALLGANGEQIKGTTGTEGTITILNLEAGTYKYKELEAPNGYILNDTMYTFVVNEDGTVNYGENNGIIYNKKKPAEPVDPDDPDKPTEPENPDNPDKPDKPTEPDTPSTPDKPDKPTNPDKPNEPTSPNVPVNPVKPDRPNDYIGNLPKTGETIAVLIIAVIALSGSGIMLTYNYIKMKKESK